MYYVAKVHKNGNKLESVEICDTSDGIIDFILVEDLSDYKNFDIDGIDGTKVRVSKKALGSEYFNKILSKGKEDGTLPTISEKIHIPLIRISCDTRNISSSIQWYEKDYAYYIKDEDDDDDDVNGWFDCHELDIDLYAVINVKSCSVDLAIEMTMYNHEIDTQQEVRISSIDVSAEVIKSICDNHGDAFKLSKIINGYFYNIGTLIEEVSEGKVGLGGYISLDDDIRYCDFTDSIVTIKDRSNSSLSYLTNEG